MAIILPFQSLGSLPQRPSFPITQGMWSHADAQTPPNKERHINCIHREGVTTLLKVEGGAGALELKDIDCQYISIDKCFEETKKK